MIPLGVVASSRHIPMNKGIDPVTISECQWYANPEMLGVNGSIVDTWGIIPSTGLPVFRNQVGANIRVVNAGGGRPQVLDFPPNGRLSSTQNPFPYSNVATFFMVISPTQTSSVNRILESTTGYLKFNQYGNIFEVLCSGQKVYSYPYFYVYDWVVLSARIYTNTMYARTNLGGISQMWPPATLDPIPSPDFNQIWPNYQTRIAEMWRFGKILNNDEWDGVVKFLMEKYKI